MTVERKAGVGPHESRVDVREFREGDGDALRGLWTEAGFRLIGDDDAGLRRFAARNPGLFLVGLADGEIVASAMGAWDGRRGWLYHVAVAPSHRRMGIATDLVARIETSLRALGCPRVLVMVEADNDAGLELWLKLGYERRGTHQLGKSF
jgi:ribosomal protein S18 acetylase RimI-like enzyme